jgi:tRNA dimethylallyltransferase
MSIVAVVVGPTAVGKTDVLVEALEGFPAEIISADSRQIYRHMNIGTAKPNPDQRRKVVHHLIDCVDPDQPFDAARYAEMAQEAIADVLDRDGFPVVSGGSGFYIRALLEGFFEGPGADPGLREDLLAAETTHGRGTLHRRLAHVDPDSAERIHPNDLFRTVRALEVFERSGLPLTRWLHQGKAQKLPHPVFIVGLYRIRADLYRRIDDRVDEMMSQGLLAEVAQLRDLGYAQDMVALSTVGYREVMMLLDGQIGREEAVSLMKRNTRKYAKRQMTWFSKMENVFWIQADEAAPNDRDSGLRRMMEGLYKGRRPPQGMLAPSRERMLQAWRISKDERHSRPNRRERPS